MDPINWYPGHMKKTRTLIQENLKMVDAVLEVIDARIPRSSRNPMLGELLAGKPEILVFNKCDLADPEVTNRWQAAFRREDFRSCAVESLTGRGMKELFIMLTALEDRRRRAAPGSAKARKPLRLMIVGVPNVGKSSLINRLTGKKSTRTGNKPGVTRGKQWLTLKNGMQLLDTPGILQPKLASPEVGEHLAFCGSIRDEILDLDTLGLDLIRLLSDRYPDLLKARYGLDEVPEDGLEAMEAICRKRGFIMPGKRLDYTRCARTVIDEFREGKIGRISLEEAE